MNWHGLTPFYLIDYLNLNLKNAAIGAPNKIISTSIFSGYPISNMALKNIVNTCTDEDIKILKRFKDSIT